METKKTFMFAALAATVLASASCSSDDGLENLDYGRGVVKAEFTISFPSQMSNAITTRLGQDIVQGQADPVFRGITRIQLRPFSDQKDDIDDNTTLKNPITLLGGTVGKTGYSSTEAYAIDAGSLYSISNAHLYKDLEIPIGTKAFMFYGVAADKTPAGGKGANTVNGALKQSENESKVSDIKFSPVPIVNTDNGTNQQATDIAAYLTAIANATTPGGTKWSNSTGTIVQLGALYDSFTAIKAGSWRSVKAAVQQLYTALASRTDDLSKAIKDAITNNYTIGEHTDPVNFATAPQTGTTLTFNDKDYSYPENIGLPDGAVYVNWSRNDSKFDVVTPNDNLGLNVQDLGAYAYPASLYYRGLSNIRVSNETMASHYNDNNSWQDIIDEYPNSDGTVASTTRSIAIKDQMQYAVARLDATVKANSNSLPDSKGNNITIDQNFPITGLLVSKQKTVNYKFEATNEGTDYTVYDSEMPSGAYLYYGTNPSSTLQTLLLETPEATDDEDANAINADIPIAVEFLNKSEQIICGKDNQLIYPRTKFYLVGTLKPYQNTSVTDNNGELIKRAFLQDYVTKVTLNIKSFKNAYNVLPDLRMPSIEIGLSVDLTWKDGIEQSIEIE